MAAERSPRRGDVAFGVAFGDDAGETMTYVDFLVGPYRDAWFEVIDDQGAAHLVERAPQRDAQLRSAVHDDGNRLAWRVVFPGS